MGGNKILPFCVFFLLMFSGHVFSDKSDKKSRPKTVLDDQVKSRQASETYPAIVNLYRPNYILPYYYTGSPYQEIYLLLYRVTLPGNLSVSDPK